METYLLSGYANFEIWMIWMILRYFAEDSKAQFQRRAQHVSNPIPIWVDLIKFGKNVHSFKTYVPSYCSAHPISCFTTSKLPTLHC